MKVRVGPVFCKDCKHYLMKWWWSEPKCAASKVNLDEVRDLVSGELKAKARTYLSTCEDEREYRKHLYGHCGPLGANFEQKTWMD